MRTLYFLISFFLIALNGVFAQSDSTHLFEKSKGSWRYPIDKYSKLEKIDLGNGLLKSVGIISISSQSVKSIYDGLIVEIDSFNYSYGVKVKFGDYYILYSGLTKPTYVKGSFIKRGQIFAFVKDQGNNVFRLDISLIKNDLFIDPFSWFEKSRL